MLQPFGTNVWIADGPPVTVVWPLRLPTRMIVVKLSNGSLWIESPVDVSTTEMDEVARLGEVVHLVSPARLHNWRLASWKAHFPKARCWMTPEILTDTPPSQWADDLDQVVFRGNAFARETEFYHRPSRTLLFNDFIQRNALTGGRLAMPIDIKLSIIEKELARQSLRKLLSWDFDKLIIAHGDGASAGAKESVASALRFLLPA
ncbi:MAG TPA: DUF4336 domain-containing protein [Candidatus Acidoferrales bacterium]|nr:DUF4336 domain-containing protein [Candidatus Acidoferrales bacterium]